MHVSLKGDWRSQLKAVKGFFHELQNKREYDLAIKQRAAKRRKEASGAKSRKVA